jgi:prepilin-type processing-associated H-X9-DG protein
LLVVAPLTSILERFGRELVPPIPGRYVVPPALRAVVLAGIAERTGRSILAVVPGEREAEDLAEDVALFSSEIHHLPAWETLPFEHVSPSIPTMADRVVARHALSRPETTIVVSSVRAATQRLSPTPVDPIHVVRGEETSFDDLVVGLADLGYRRTDRVEGKGEFAVRGGIVDVYPTQSPGPVRIDFWGDAAYEEMAYFGGESSEEMEQTEEEEPIRLTDTQKASLRYVGGFGSFHPSVANFLFGDGSVKALPDVMDFGIYQQLGHRDDGKLLKSDRY